MKSQAEKIGPRRLPGLRVINSGLQFPPLWLTHHDLPLPMPRFHLHPLTLNKMELTISDSLSSYCDYVRMKQTVNMEMLVNPSIKKVIKTNRLQQKEPISKIGLKGNWN